MPPAQVSLVVQALPSEQEAVLFVWVHPDCGSQASSVQPLPSSQLGAGPPTQMPPAQVSLVVQALPSEQEAVLFVWVHPDCGSQASSVQPLPSSQFGAGPPTQIPAAQVSLVVQALPSEQEAVLFVWVHPDCGVRRQSSVQTLPSLQSGAGPPTQTPAAQVSLVVQALPSEQEAVLSVWVHPDCGSQASSVQTLPSSQFGARDRQGPHDRVGVGGERGGGDVPPLERAGCQEGQLSQGFLPSIWIGDSR